MNEEYLIKKISFWDIPKVVRMYEESSDELKRKFHNPPPLSSIGLPHQYLSTTFLKPLLMIRITSLVAKKGDEIVGYTYINERRYLKEDRKDFGIMVKEGYQGKGLGSKLMAEILKDQDDVWLTVLDDNESAIKLYEKHGFKFESMMVMRKMRFKTHPVHEKDRSK